MEISIEHFLNLKFYHEFHEYHNEGSKCIYQDLIKNNKSIKEILFCLRSDPEYLDTEKYESSDLLKYDHMKHYIYCIVYGFRKDVIEWKEPASKYKLENKKYYLSKEKMSDKEIEMFLLNNKIKIGMNNIILDGLHRCFCMIGRILRGEKYIMLNAEKTPLALKSLVSHRVHKLKRPKIKNVGYRKKDNRNRLKLIDANIESSNFTLLDVGSNYGYFSLDIAAKYSNSAIYSIEGSYGTGNEDVYETCKNEVLRSKGVQTHCRLKKKYNVFNNHIFCMLMTKDVIDSLLKNRIRFDFQLSLSVFHWIAYERFGNNGNPDELYRLLVDHLSLANITFLELPDIKQQTSLSPIYKNHDSLHDLFQYIKTKYMLDIDINILGKHNWYGTRHLYKIGLNNSISCKFSKDDLINICEPMQVF